ncbi:hypothetical protein PR048_022190 [Dryococelus australis]|uniref:Uncharacterized protein n=1 Tax=Dryococelus australis TaxID=614101 RepID=A0ABQ9H0F5_9NEOP|nr:hypothetical protein PR048_022190 [Dryococelus australis]
MHMVKQMFVPGVMMEGAATCCFVCDKEVAGSGVLLLMGQTLHSHTGLPTKIGQLLGEEFVVVVQTEDVLCRRCEVLLNHLDLLEVEMVVVKRQLTAFLQAKYQLSYEPSGVFIARHSSHHKRCLCLSRLLLFK